MRGSTLRVLGGFEGRIEEGWKGIEGYDLMKKSGGNRSKRGHTAMCGVVFQDEEVHFWSWRVPHGLPPVGHLWGGNQAEAPPLYSGSP